MILNTNQQSGQSLIEALIALSIFVLGIATIGFLVLDANVSTRQGVERTQATLLAKEGLEAARSIRDNNFSNLTIGPHGISLAGNVWTFSGASDAQDQFTRVITISDIDVDTKQIESRVSWQFTEARSNNVELITYLTNWDKTVAPTTCVAYCQNLGYANGTCRQNVSQCKKYGETNESGGDQYCAGGPSADTCCCAP